MKESAAYQAAAAGQHAVDTHVSEGPTAPSDTAAEADRGRASGVTSKKDQRKIQDQMNAWAKETGLPYTHLSRICAMSIGENYAAETLRTRGGGEE